MRKIITAIFLIALFVSCNSDDNNPNNNLGSSAKYKVSVTLNWSASNFPTNYPSGAHFSRLIGWTHNSKSTFFNEGTLATSGIKNMAETGGISPLNSEIQSKIANNEGLELILGSGLGSGTGTIDVEINVNQQHSYVTLSTMIAPSPDWYVAIVGVNLFENSNFVSSKTVNAFAFDAGTDSGANYTSTNQVTNPQENIKKITSSPLNGSAPIATVTFTKL